MTRAYLSALFVLMMVLAACSQPSTLDPIAPTVTNFRAEKSTLTAGESTTLSWTDASADATLTLTPDVGNVTGQTSVTVSPTETTEYTLTVSNDAGSNQYKLTVTVKPKDTPAPTNRAPVSESVTKSTQEGTAVTVQLSGSDPDGDRLRYSVVAEPQNGSLSGLNPDTGEITYTPNTNFSGADTFTFSVSDGKLSSAVATVTVNVTAVNDAPTANAQTRSTPEETPVVVTLSGSDPEGASLEYVVTREPTHGTLGALEPTTHKVTYTPAQDYNGTDSFTFVVSDGELTSAEATVIIKVGVVNDQPVAKAQSVSLDEDTAKAITLTAQDADNNALTYAIVKQPEHGKVSGLNAGTGKVTYTPNKDYSGADSFTFKANDGTEDSEVQTVSLTINPVNDAPVIAGGDSVSVTMSEDGVPTAFALTLNASDVDTDTLTWSVSSAAAHGTASVSGTGASKDVTYSPDADYNGSDKFVVKVVDGNGGEDTITVNVTIEAVNDKPTAKTIPDQNYTFSLDLKDYFSDIDKESLTYSYVATPGADWIEIEGSVLSAKVPPAELNNTFNITVTGRDNASESASISFNLAVTCPSGVLYIDESANGIESGLTWADAFTDLQTALGWARACERAKTLNVAKGVYYPDEGYATTLDSPSAPDDRKATFYITEGIKLYGGYGAGGAGARNPGTNVTVLSGDIRQDDVTTGDGVVQQAADIRGDNSLHVVFVDGGNEQANVTGETVIDGLTITGGQATVSGDGIGTNGGGLHCRGGDEGNECSPKLAGLHFAGNYAVNGGGMYNDGTLDGKSNPYLSHVTFSGNVAKEGAAMYNAGFGYDPYGSNEVGEIKRGESSPTVVNAVFTNNTVEHSISSSYEPGIVSNMGPVYGKSRATLINVIFGRNNGTAIFNQAEYFGTSSLLVINGTFYKNSIAVVTLDDPAHPGVADATIINSILWENEQVVEGSPGDTSFSYSIVPPGVCDQETPCDNVFDTIEFPFISSTDLRLKAGSPAINRGSNSAIQATGVDTDLDGKTRIVGNIVDLGAYEKQ